MAALQDDEYEIPLRDQRFFGAGLKRKRVQFVPSRSNNDSVQSSPATPSTSAADKYLSIVLKKPAEVERAASAPLEETVNIEEGTAEISSSKPTLEEESEQTCEVCKRPITSADAAVHHETSIAHQICLQHSHPPSHLDRRRKGLAVLESQGWDPDSRRGLGADGGGILHPIKPKENPQKAGLGARFDKVKALEKPARLDAGKVRLMEKEGKKKAEKLRNAFYRSEDMEKYLGGEGEVNGTLDLRAFKQSRRR